MGLIDADILVYRIGFSTQDVSENFVKARLNTSFNLILDSLLLSDYTSYITSTDKSNYRYQIEPLYKANRTQERPKHYDFIREQLLTNPLYKCQQVFNMEADDAIGIHSNCFSSFKESCIISIDKDLDQIPGWHYNFVKKQKYYISRLNATRFFYKQILTGDKVDNIAGITGIGSALANRLINPLTTEEDMFGTVNYIYSETNTTTEELIRRGQLLKIRQQQNEPLWQPPEALLTIKKQPDQSIEADWRKSFLKFSKKKEKTLNMNQ